MQRQGLALTSIFLATLLFAPWLAPRAWTQAEPFYKGKTIRIMVGSTAGGFMTVGPVSSPDTWANTFPDNRKSSLKTCPEPAPDRYQPRVQCRQTRRSNGRDAA